MLPSTSAGSEQKSTMAEQDPRGVTEYCGGDAELLASLGNKLLEGGLGGGPREGDCEGMCGLIRLVERASCPTRTCKSWIFGASAWRMVDG